MDIHYARGVPCIVQEIDGYYYDHYDDIELVEDLQDQETVYQLITKNRRVNGSEPSSSTPSEPASKLSQTGTGETTETQLKLDEAVARSLQEMENQFAATSLAVDGADSSAVDHVSSPATSGSTSSELVAREDDIDPDNMTYEELQSLGEAIGSESKGLTDELISYLPTSKYKTGFFSKKDKSESWFIVPIGKVGMPIGMPNAHVARHDMGSRMPMDRHSRHANRHDRHGHSAWSKRVLHRLEMERHSRHDRHGRHDV